ncbi:hypothetical protein F4604DRAFT_1687766 [Suillus subluteus]|nr:hypothetical protein F4604DRAFT_1687766 [Suillus subluteus]
MGKYLSKLILMTSMIPKGNHITGKCVVHNVLTTYTVPNESRHYTHGPKWEPSTQAGPYIHHGSDQGTVPNGSRPDRQVFNYPLREINQTNQPTIQMEYGMCKYLAREFNRNPAMLRQFEDMIKKDFADKPSYHTSLPVTPDHFGVHAFIWLALSFTPMRCTVTVNVYPAPIRRRALGSVTRVVCNEYGT